MNNYDRMHRGEEQKPNIPENRARTVVVQKRKKAVKIIFAVLLVFSCIMLIGLFDVFGYAFSNALYGAFGCFAIAFDIVLMAVCVLKLLGAQARRLSARTILFMVILCVLLVMFMQILSTVNDFRALAERNFKNYLDTCYVHGRNNAGGAFFAIFSYPFLSILGSVTSLCVIAVLFFGALLYCFRSFFYIEKKQTIVSEESSSSGMYIETFPKDKRDKKGEKEPELSFGFPNDVSPDAEYEQEEKEEAEIEYTAGTISDKLVSNVFDDKLDQATRQKRAEELLFMSEEDLKKTIQSKSESEQVVQNSAIKTGERKPYQTGFGGDNQDAQNSAASDNGENNTTINKKLSVEEAYKNYTLGGITAEQLLFGNVIETQDLSYDELYPQNNSEQNRQRINDILYGNSNANQQSNSPNSFNSDFGNGGQYANGGGGQQFINNQQYANNQQFGGQGYYANGGQFVNNPYSNNYNNAQQQFMGGQTFGNPTQFGGAAQYGNGQQNIVNGMNNQYNGGQFAFGNQNQPTQPPNPPNNGAQNFGGVSDNIGNVIIKQDVVENQNTTANTNQNIEQNQKIHTFQTNNPMPDIMDTQDAVSGEDDDLNEIENNQTYQPFVPNHEGYVPQDNPFKTVFRELTEQDKLELSAKKGSAVNVDDDDFDDEDVDGEQSDENQNETINKPLVQNKPKPQQKPMKQEKKVKKPYVGPSLALLGEPDPPVSTVDYVTVYKQIEDAFKSYDINCKVIAHTKGPTFTLYAVQLGDGVYFKKVISREEDIQRKLCSDEPINIVPTVRDMDAIGIEVFYRAQRATVPLKRYLVSEKYKEPNKLYFPIGIDVYGEPYYCNLFGAPHLLIGGTTGSGKSICINTILCSILYNYSPDYVKLILVDPKSVELAAFATIPHNLLGESINNAPDCIKALQWAVDEMERRYAIMKSVNTKQISTYNQVMKEQGQAQMPYIVIIVDELADLMLSSKKTAPEIEKRINQLTAKSRACGIHLILATQRPSTEIITGLIKNNVSTRIAFTMGDVVASKVIIDRGGAEKLYGRGDLLYSSQEYSKPLRLQAPFVSDFEVISITDYVKENNEFDRDESIYDEIFNEKPVPMDTMIGGATDSSKQSASEMREKNFNGLFNQVLQYAVNQGVISISKIQRQFGVGFLKAGNLVDKMEELGIIDKAVPGSSKPRTVLIHESDLPNYLLDEQGGEEDE